MNGQLELIKRFLDLKRIAVVGVSRNPADFTRKLWSDFREKGCEAIPVHPSQNEIDGVHCYHRVQDIALTVEGALLLVSRDKTMEVVNDCITAGIRIIWLYGIRGEKDVDRDIVTLCRGRKIDVIAGHCPYMFLPKASLFHRIHGLVWKLIGYYPR